MKIRVVLILIGFSILAVCAFGIKGMAQNDDETLIELGTISRVEAGQLVIKEYNYDTNSDEDMKYVINDKTQFENIKSLADLKAGDSVEVFYEEAGGNKVALSVSKEENYDDDEDEADGSQKVAGTTIENVEAPAMGETVASTTSGI